VSVETKRKTRILLADGYDVVRQGIRHILEREPDFEVVGDTDNGQEAVKLARELRPDVLLMEARMAKLDSVEITRRVKAEHPEAAVVVLTTCDDEEHIMGLIGAGAAGYLLKSARADELAQAIRFVRGGEFVCHPVVAQKLYKRATCRPIAVNSVEHLTHRELEVLKLAARGMSNCDIAGELGVGLRTVKGHLESIFNKMGVRSRTEAVLEAMKRNWVSLLGEEK
jgi:DNA-binding NarL/FixJ family response regulator